MMRDMCKAEIGLKSIFKKIDWIIINMIMLFFLTLKYGDVMFVSVGVLFIYNTLCIILCKKWKSKKDVSNVATYCFWLRK